MTDRRYPVLPYGPEHARNSGWSGSEASRDRAHREDADGTTTQRQRAVVAFLTDAGTYGATWPELGEVYGWHHGQATSALSDLHKVGMVARLSADHNRDRCSVYVTPDNVDGRDTAPHGRARPLAGVSTDALWDELARRDGWWE